jgi:glycolate oxidase subunit GlcD
MATESAIGRDLARVVGGENVLEPPAAHFLHDETETRGLAGKATAVVFPGGRDEVAEVVAWCYEREIPIVPRGGGTGFAGGAVPLAGGVVLALDRLRAVRSFDPLFWRIEVEAGLRTADLRRLVRESGLLFPPDPGAAEDSQIGGNIATNAGGPHAFKYGVTGAWVSGLEVVVPPGELVAVGGPVRKDVAGFDLKSLLVGSEGTLGVITAAWLKLIPAPEASYPVAAFFPNTGSGCESIERTLGSGLQVAALEYLDEATLAAAGGSFPGEAQGAAGFLIVAEADGSRAEAESLRTEVIEALAAGSVGIHAPTETRAVADLWRWRDGVSIAVTTLRGGKVSEDIVVPLDRLSEAIAETVEIGKRHGLPACSWGHAGDGNLHSTFMVDRTSEDELTRAGLASAELFDLAVRLGGSVSGEHGVGSVKRAYLGLQLSPKALELLRGVKEVFDPKGLMNPGKVV